MFRIGDMALLRRANSCSTRGYKHSPPTEGLPQAGEPAARLPAARWRAIPQINLRITFLCQYFPPEMGAPSARTFEHARHWVRLGHQVTVVTGFPNHPTGIIHPEYRGSILKRESVEGIDLLRTWVYVAPNKGFTRRILNFLSFFASSLFFGTFRTKRPDVVIGTSPQFFCALAAYLLSCLKRAPFIFEVRDIWPESAIELGALRNRALIRTLEAIELFLYRRAALIVPVAWSTRDYLIDKGISPEKICVIPNGIDASYLSNGCARTSSIRSELGLEGKFVVSYIGTHGHVACPGGGAGSESSDVRRGRCPVSPRWGRRRKGTPQANGRTDRASQRDVHRPAVPSKAHGLLRDHQCRPCAFAAVAHLYPGSAIKTIELMGAGRPSSVQSKVKLLPWCAPPMRESALNLKMLMRWWLQ